jgi:hypothetical protein
MATGNATVKKQGGNKIPKTGFHTNPERINKHGRPPNDVSFTYAMKEYIRANPEIKADILSRVALEAAKGTQWATTLLWAYMDGAPPKAKEDPGSEDNPYHHTITIRKL